MLWRACGCSGEAQEVALGQDEAMGGAERFDIGSPPGKKDGGGHDFEDAPTFVSERRVQTSVRAPASKIRSVMHDEDQM